MIDRISKCWWLKRSRRFGKKRIKRIRLQVDAHRIAFERADSLHWHSTLEARCLQSAITSRKQLKNSYRLTHAFARLLARPFISHHAAIGLLNLCLVMLIEYPSVSAIMKSNKVENCLSFGHVHTDKTSDNRKSIYGVSCELKHYSFQLSIKSTQEQSTLSPETISRRNGGRRVLLRALCSTRGYRIVLSGQLIGCWFGQKPMNVVDWVCWRKQTMKINSKRLKSRLQRPSLFIPSVWSCLM